VLFDEFIQHGLVLGRLDSNFIDGDRSQLSVVINKHEMGVGGSTNSPVLNAGNKGVIPKSKSRVVTDPGEFGFSGSPGCTCASI
jgi:hypothetical protein